MAFGCAQPAYLIALASDPQNTPPPLPSQASSGDSVRHMLFGNTEAVQKTVHNPHSRGYADPNDWSPAISTGRGHEVMRLLIKRVSALGG